MCVYIYIDICTHMCIRIYVCIHIYAYNLSIHLEGGRNLTPGLGLQGSVLGHEEGGYPPKAGEAKYLCICMYIYAYIYEYEYEYESVYECVCVCVYLYI